MEVVNGLVPKERQLIMMASFENFLWWIFIVFTLICSGLCIEAHYRYKNKNGIDNEHKFSNKYKYFGQPIYDEQNRIRGYELLLREYDHQTHNWQLPQNVVDFPLSKIVSTIQEINPQLEEIANLSLNMTVSQITDFRSKYFFTWVLGTINVKQLVIELDANDIRCTNIFKRKKLLHIFKKLSHHQIKVTIENVDSSKKTYSLLQQYLPYITYLKFNAHSFNKSVNHWIDITLAQWQRRIAIFNIEMIVGKIEDANHIVLVNQLHIPFRQGYAYGHPKNFKK